MLTNNFLQQSHEHHKTHQLTASKFDTTQPIKILILEPFDLIRDGIAAIFNKDATVQLAGKYASANDIVPASKRHNPDVIVMNQWLHNASCPALIQDIHRLNLDIRVLVYVTRQQKTISQDIIEAGIHGYFICNVASNELVSAVKQIMTGQKVLGPDATRAFFSNQSKKTEPSYFPLSKREKQVLVLMCDGLTNGEIAYHLDIKISTVKTYVSRILTKLNAVGRVEAVKIVLTSDVMTVAH